MILWSNRVRRKSSRPRVVSLRSDSGGKPRSHRRRPLLHHTPLSPPPNVVGQSPPAIGGGGTRFLARGCLPHHPCSTPPSSTLLHHRLALPVQPSSLLPACYSPPSLPHRSILILLYSRSRSNPLPVLLLRACLPSLTSRWPAIVLQSVSTPPGALNGDDLPAPGPVARLLPLSEPPRVVLWALVYCAECGLAGGPPPLLCPAVLQLQSLWWVQLLGSTCAGGCCPSKRTAGCFQFRGASPGKSLRWFVLEMAMAGLIGVSQPCWGRGLGDAPHIGLSDWCGSERKLCDGGACGRRLSLLKARKGTSCCLSRGACLVVALCLLPDSSIYWSLAVVGGYVAHSGALWCVSAPWGPLSTPVARGCRGVILLRVAFSTTPPMQVVSFHCVVLAVRFRQTMLMACGCCGVISLRVAFSTTPPMQVVSWRCMVFVTRFRQTTLMVVVSLSRCVWPFDHTPDAGGVVCGIVWSRLRASIRLHRWHGAPAWTRLIGVVDYTGSVLCLLSSCRAPPAWVCLFSSGNCLWAS
jgi:hypothetical protein